MKTRFAGLSLHESYAFYLPIHRAPNLSEQFHIRRMMLGALPNENFSAASFFDTHYVASGLRIFRDILERIGIFDICIISTLRIAHKRDARLI